MSRSFWGRAAAGTVLGSLGALALSGFPARVGLTKAQCRVSLAGDLLVPVPAMVGDRARSYSASPADLWPQLLALEDLYRDVWDCDLSLVYEEKQSLLVWSGDSVEGGAASLSVCLLPEADGRTVVHLRERYEAPARLRRLATAIISVGIWHRLRPRTQGKV